jgi:hypothetical protein
MMHPRKIVTLLALVLASASAPAFGRSSLIVVAGVGGQKEYQESFVSWAESWRAAGIKGGATVTAIGLPGSAEDCLTPLRTALQQESPDSMEPLWLVLLGHGTYDGREARFNLRGEDLTVAELVEWLKPMRRPVVVVAAFSASGAFLAPLSAPGRILVTATKSGGENNYARFGEYLSASIADPSADLDHDGQTSLLEAWLRAARQTADFYKSDGRIATEHSLLDDNGDGRGTPADWFQGLRVVKKSSDGGLPDGTRAHQMHLVASTTERELPPAARAERDALELQVAQLREGKGSMAEDEYYAKLEAIFLRLAAIYREAPAASSR